RHLRAGLRHAVGLHDGRAAVQGLPKGVPRYRAAADQNRAGAREVRAGLEQPDQLGGNERDHADVSGDERARNLLRVEAVEQDRRRPVDRRADHYRETRDVAEGQAAEPAVAGIDAEVEGGPDRAEEEVAVGQADGPRLAGGAAGQDPALEVVHVVLAEQREVGLGLVSSAASFRSTAGLSAASTAARSASVSWGPSGSATAPSFISACRSTTSSRRGCIVSAAVPPFLTPKAARRRATQVASASSSA